MRRLLEVRLVVDAERRIGRRGGDGVTYDTSLTKEEVARHYIFGRSGEGLAFLDVGARDGRLEYLLGIRRNLEFDAQLYARESERFHRKYVYYGLDVVSGGERFIEGDVCDPSLLEHHPEFDAFFDVVYSNNVFEHLRRPWIAAGNLFKMLKPGGICITITPFSLRYHESPADYFRYTHTAIPALFEEYGRIRVLSAGYDISGRRNDWQGSGDHADLCPVDRFGAWRENWFTIVVLERLA